MAAAIAEKNAGVNLPAKEINVGQPSVVPAPVAPTPGSSPREQMLNRISSLSRARQLQLIIALASALALIVVIMMWSSKPTYKLLYGNLSDKSSGEIVDALQKKNIPYQIDEQSGQVLVPPDKVHEVRIALAAQGLPHTDGGGFEMMEKQPGFGSSQFMEMARYNRAMEGELGRTVAGMAGVEAARVHLAIPKQSVFIRDRQEPSASVLVNLVPGKTMSEDEVAAVVHLVSGSIPNLKPDKVTVVDQSGKMLTKREVSGDLSLSAAQFDFKRKLEEYYILRIERIVMPVVGFEAVRAQVDADVDFSVTESTKETFNPDLPSVRSEQTIEEETKGGEASGGVPGALTNQPPQAGSAPEQAKGQGGGGGGDSGSRKSKRATYNYELDKTISHTRQAPGNLRRLSVAVVVDDKITADAAGTIIHTPLAPEEVERLAGLVREAVGYNAQRGDSVTVINAAFQGAPPLPIVPPTPIWEQPWAIDIAKQAMGAFAVLMVLIIMVRPVVKAWTIKEEAEPAQLAAAGALSGPEGAEGGQADRDGLAPADWEIVGKTDDDYEKMLAVLRKLVTDDPRLVAQVIRTWVAVDESSS